MKALNNRSLLLLKTLFFVLLASDVQSQILMKGTKATTRKDRTTEMEGCSLSATAANAMRPMILRPDMVVRPDQYAALETILSYLDRLLTVNPKFVFYDDQGSGNAFATPEQLDPQFPDGTVMMGARLITSEANKTGPVNFTVGAIMAHEFAHILQFKLGEELPSRQKEVEADYMAGWYMGNVSGMWLGAASSQALRSFYSKGDYEFNSPTHHGTPEERAAAVETGLKDARSSLKQAFAHAHRYVAGE
jgi:hypothetical protein